MTYQAKVIAGGKVVIPAEMRHELGIKDGDSLVVERDGNGGIVFKTYAQVAGEVQARMRELRGNMPANGVGVVDELLTERQEAGRREDAEFAAWAMERG